MLYREIISTYSEIHTKHINILCGQNVEIENVKLVVYIVTTGFYRVIYSELHIKIQSVPRSKHTQSRLYKPVS
jgi:hypothetical protein